MRGDVQTGVPQVSRLQGLKDASWMADNPAEVLHHYTKSLGDVFYYHFGGGLRYLVTTRPSVIKHVLKKDADSYFKSEIQTKRMREFLGKGLLTLHGQHWRDQRKQIQAGFRPDKLEAITPIMHVALDEGLARLDAAAKDGPVDVPSHMTGTTFGMVMRSLFGAALPQQDIARMGEIIPVVEHFLLRRVVQPHLGPWFHLSGAISRHQALRRQADEIVLRQIVGRQESGERDEDMLQVLLDARYPETGEPMTRTQLLSESMQLLVAAHETSSTSVSWALFQLCRNPQYIEICRQEIAEVLGDAPLGSKDVNRLPKTQNVLREVLRLYPAFWMVDRMAEQDNEVDGIRIEKGERVAIFFYGSHRNPAFWSNPESFYPERFDDEAKTHERIGAYTPFGAGPRVCIGRALAMIQMMMLLTEILRRYDFELTTSRDIRPQPRLILHAGGGIPMTFKPRRTA